MPQQLRKISLGETDGFRYMGFQPPLTGEELAGLPMPVVGLTEDDAFESEPTSVECFPVNNSMDIGWYDDAFGPFAEGFVPYAREVARHLGGCSLDEKVYLVGPGSVVAQAEGAPAQW